MWRQELKCFVPVVYFLFEGVCMYIWSCKADAGAAIDEVLCIM